MKRKRKHIHTIGQYRHDSGSVQNYSYGSDRDGIGDQAGYYAFCPDCGKKITKEIIKEYEKK